MIDINKRITTMKNNADFPLNTYRPTEIHIADLYIIQVGAGLKSAALAFKKPWRDIKNGKNY